MFECLTSGGITSAERTHLVLVSQDLANAWRSAEIERGQLGGMTHDHYCTDCGSECSEDFEDCVLGTRTQCEACRNKDLYGHQHSCPVCHRSWPCTSRMCIDEVSALCGDCFEPQGETATQRKDNFVGLSLMSAASTIGVLAGFNRLPYDFYSLLRFVLCLTAAVGLAGAVRRQAQTWLWVFGVAVILYNPLWPVHLRSKSTWEVINVLTVGLFWLAVYRLRTTEPKGNVACPKQQP